MSTVYTTTLTLQTCIACGVPFALSRELNQQRLEDHKNFYCPNGHSQYYVGKTDAQKLAEAQGRLEVVQRRHRATRELLHAEERSHSATRGHVTRKKKELEKAKAGVCPVKDCHRHFTNLERHIATKHPDYAP